MSSPSPPPRSRSTCGTARWPRRASRSAASQRCRGARPRPRTRCAASGSTTAASRRLPRPPSRRRAAASTTRSRSRSASARSRARSTKPPAWRSEREPQPARTWRLVMASAAAPAPKANMGEPAPRLDARLKVTGEARYPADVALDHPAHAVLVTSSIAKGRITGLSLDAARAVPGVLDILTHENTGELKQLKFQQAGSATSIQSLGPEIFHDGQIIAVVLGDTLEAAQEGAGKVAVSYAAAPPSASFASGGTTQDDITKVSQQHKELPQVGDAEAALAGAAVEIAAEYATPAQHHNPMELF